ncbi:hypothetical protein GCM10027406_35310 [Leifsonia lichenia]
MSGAWSLLLSPVQPTPGMLGVGCARAGGSRGRVRGAGMRIPAPRTSVRTQDSFTGAPRRRPLALPDGPVTVHDVSGTK